MVNGSQTGPLGITPDQLTDEVWDFILSNPSPDRKPPNSTIPTEKLLTLQREFSYFYPMDIRSSGKDLIGNHLTFAIYNHAALFEPNLWPLSMRANGHLMLNGKKMSKSTGNSLTLRDSLDKFGADATRLALADAGDGIEDANFEEKTANAAIMRLYTLIEWCEVSDSFKIDFRLLIACTIRVGGDGQSSRRYFCWQRSQCPHWWKGNIFVP